jgi:hypothetical protein
MWRLSNAQALIFIAAVVVAVVLLVCWRADRQRHWWLAA